MWSRYPSKKRQKTSIFAFQCGPLLLIALSLISLLILYISIQLLEWAYRRCLWSYIFPTSTTIIDCAEAHYHEKSRILLNVAKDTLVLSPSPPSPFSHQVIHFTLSSIFRNNHFWNLGLCALQSAARFAPVYLWVKDITPSIRSRLEKIKGLEIILMKKFIDNIPHSQRTWLERRLSSLIDDIHPNHISDLFRIIALYYFGGIYLDLDLIMVDDRPLRLGNSLNIQRNEKSAYLANGEFIKLHAYHPFIQRYMDDLETWFSHWRAIERYGFIGPAAITRISVDHLREWISVGPDLIDFYANGVLVTQNPKCNNYMKSPAWHFVGKKKRMYPCVLNKIEQEGMCPDFIEDLRESNEHALKVQ